MGTDVVLIIVVVVGLIPVGLCAKKNPGVVVLAALWGLLLGMTVVGRGLVGLLGQLVNSLLGLS